MLTIILPTHLTFAEIESPEALATINALLVASGKPATVLGAPNPFFRKIQNIVAGGGYFDRGPETARCTIKNTSFIKTTDVQLVCAAGGEVLGFEAYFKLPGLDGQVPASFPNRTYVDGNGQEQIHTWATWDDPHVNGNGPVKHGDFWYRISLHTSDGVHLLASAWSTSGLEVLSRSQYDLVAQSQTNADI